MTTNSDLYKKILKASKIIHEKSFRGTGNYIILNSESVEMIERYESKIKKKEDRKKKLKQIEKLSGDTYVEISNQIEERKKESEKYSQKFRKF